VKTSDQALKVLIAGNQRFVERKLTFYKEDLAILQQNTAEKQVPFASVSSCADSRVSVTTSQRAQNGSLRPSPTGRGDLRWS
jgi:carbonic anhydrase